MRLVWASAELSTEAEAATAGLAHNKRSRKLWLTLRAATRDNYPLESKRLQCLLRLKVKCWSCASLSGFRRLESRMKPFRRIVNIFLHLIHLSQQTFSFSIQFDPLILSQSQSATVDFLYQLDWLIFAQYKSAAGTKKVMRLTMKSLSPQTNTSLS